LKRRDLERHLLAEGCRFVKESSNHTRWEGPTGEWSVVPRHREIDYWLARKICRDLEVSGPRGSR
jgi:predicted RNA binding protein YcfA (HicA-like mRNA interferase family)